MGIEGGSIVKNEAAQSIHGSISPKSPFKVLPTCQFPSLTFDFEKEGSL